MNASAAPTELHSAVSAVLDAYPEGVRAKLHILRTRIHAVAAKTEGVGPLEETLKWGQPSFVTSETNSGTTLRIAATKAGGFGIFVPCASRVVPEFRALYPDAFRYDGNRGILFNTDSDMSNARIDMCSKSALTYRL